MPFNFNPFPILQTNCLQLRRLFIADKEQLAHLRSNEQVNKYLNRPPFASLSDAEIFINGIDANLQDGISVYWVISLKDDLKLIGTICLWNFNQERNMADIGFELFPAYQGKGIMQEAVIKVIKYGFNVLNLAAIIAVTHPHNSSSGVLLKKNGFNLDADCNYVSKQDADGQLVYFLLNTN